MTSRQRPWIITGRARGAPPSTAGRRVSGALARVGAPPLIALASALGLLALLFCALFVPGFVLRADAGTTTSTQVLPGGAGAAGTTTTATVPAEPILTEPCQGRQLVTLPWGDGAGEVGLAQPTEGLTRGPEA